MKTKRNLTFALLLVLGSAFSSRLNAHHVVMGTAYVVSSTPNGPGTWLTKFYCVGSATWCCVFNDAGRVEDINVDIQIIPDTGYYDETTRSGEFLSTE